MAFDPEGARRDFPMLSRTMAGKPFVYLDTAATAQKPKAVIDAIATFYGEEYGTVHRAVYEYASLASEKYAAVRRQVQAFIGANREEEIIFTRGTTEAINIVALCYGRDHVRAGDEIVVTEMEHHANLVPWQMVCEEVGATLVVLPVNEQGELILPKAFSPKTKIVAVGHISNVLGTINPIETLTRMAHEVGAVIVVDGAQSVPHIPVPYVCLISFRTWLASATSWA